MLNSTDPSGQFESPGGFVFGVQGWTWGEQRPRAITFFLDGTCKVFDQHGRTVKGCVIDNKPVYFDKCSHAQVIAALEAENIDWKTLACSGWPQLPYAKLKALKELPPTPVEELRKIPDSALRKDALKIKREAEEARAKEFQTVDED